MNLSHFLSLACPWNSLILPFPILPRTSCNKSWAILKCPSSAPHSDSHAPGIGPSICGVMGSLSHWLMVMRCPRPWAEASLGIPGMWVGAHVCDEVISPSLCWGVLRGGEWPFLGLTALLWCPRSSWLRCNWEPPNWSKGLLCAWGPISYHIT